MRSFAIFVIVTALASFNLLAQSSPEQKPDKDSDKKAGASVTSKKEAKKGDTLYQSYVTLHRKGDFVMPVEAEIHFDNGEKIREHWDGQSRWTRFGYQKKTKVVSAEIDPDHKILLDRNNFNNSQTSELNGKPAHKLANYWLFITQFLSQAAGWWAV